MGLDDRAAGRGVVPQVCVSPSCGMMAITGVHQPMQHDLRMDHLTRQTWAAYCSCGRWSSYFTLDDVRIDQPGGLTTFVEEGLAQKQAVHVAAERRDLP